MKKRVIIILIGLVFVLTFVLMINTSNRIKNLSNEDKKELMSVLGIKNASSFSPISINRVDLGIGDATKCYILKFEISIDDYNDNSLTYQDKDTAELTCNWKEKINDKTYICYVREWEYTNNPKDLFNEICNLNHKY